MVNLTYQGRRFKVITTFGDSAFKHLIEWARNELHMDLVTCVANSNVPRAKNEIRFVKERLRSVQSETPFKKYPRMLTIEMMKRDIVLINSFRRKSGVHFVMSLRQISFGKEFKTTLCKMRELVLAYNVKASNTTSSPRVFHTLYIGPNDDGTGHSVFKLSTKKDDHHTEI